MSYTLDLSKYNRLSGQLAVKKEKLRNAKSINAKVDELLEKKRRYSSMLEVVDAWTLALKTVYTACEEEVVSFRYSRIDFLQGKITEHLGDVFPHEQLVAQIDRDFTHGNAKLELNLIDSWGESRDPFVSEGKLAQQLTSYISARTIAHLLRSNKMYLDEAFSQSDDDNLGKISQILQRDQQDGTQIILIEHKSAVYKDIPHREISLHKNPLTLASSVTITDM